MAEEVEKETEIRAVPPWDEPALEQLVDREEQLEEFQDRLQRIRQHRSLSPTFLEWYGGPGIGKTQLIRLLAKVCQERRYAHAVVNFKSLWPVQPYLDDPTRLIEMMAEQLIGAEALGQDILNRRLNALRQSEQPDNMVAAYARLSRHDLLYRRPEWLDRMRDVAASFIGLVRSLGLAEKIENDNPSPRHEEEERFTKPVALFFDETDYAPANLIYWLEEWIISPLLASRHCVIVWTARTPWRWRKPDVQRLVNSRPLQTFTPDQSKEQLKSGDGFDLPAELFRQVFALTHGHPAANRVAQEEMEKWPDLPAPTLLSKQEEKKLLQAIFERVIKRYAFKHLSTEEADALQRMALVRWFDAVMLQALLPFPEDDEFKGWSALDFGELLQRLKRTQLLAWRKGLTLDPALRPLIHDYYRFCVPILYIKANQVALEVYGQWLDRAIDNRNLYLIEELYHGTLLEQGGETILVDSEPVTVAAHLQRRLEQYRQWIPDAENRRHVLHLLQGEIEVDEDLVRLGVNESLSAQVQHFLQREEQEAPNAESG